MFQEIQLYMGDRNPRRSSKGTEPTYDPDILAVGIIYKAHIFEILRDELYLQLCKQTNKTKEVDSMRKGWELIASAIEIEKDEKGAPAPTPVGLYLGCTHERSVLCLDDKTKVTLPSKLFPSEKAIPELSPIG